MIIRFNGDFHKAIFHAAIPMENRGVTRNLHPHNVVQPCHKDHMGPDPGPYGLFRCVYCEKHIERQETVRPLSLIYSANCIVLTDSAQRARHHSLIVCISLDSARIWFALRPSTSNEVDRLIFSRPRR